MCLIFLSNGSLEGKRLLGDLLRPAHGLHRDVHPFGDFFGSRLAAKLLEQLLAGAGLVVDGLDHVNWDADPAGLIGDSPGDGLAEPPRGGGCKLVTAPPFELARTLQAAALPLPD